MNADSQNKPTETEYTPVCKTCGGSGVVTETGGVTDHYVLIKKPCPDCQNHTGESTDMKMDFTENVRSWCTPDCQVTGAILLEACDIIDRQGKEIEQLKATISKMCDGISKIIDKSDEEPDGFICVDGHELYNILERE